MPSPRPDERPTPLSGIRALLIDIDGVLVLRGRPIPGAAEALTRLDQARLPYRLATNTSAMSRRSIATHLVSVGVPAQAERIISAASAAADHVAAHHRDGRVFLLTTSDGRTEFDGRGLRLLADDEVDRLLAPDRPSAPARTAGAEPADDADPIGPRDVVVVGDASDAMTFRDLDRAFGLIHRGAGFIAMHRNRWWLTPRGTTLDAGALVAGLEFSALRRATLAGKPSAAFFAAGLRALAADLEAGVGSTAGSISGAGSTAGSGVGRRLRRSDVAMVGDDLWNDVLGAQRAGLRGIFVRSGKHGDAELTMAAGRRRGGGRPDHVADDLAAVVEGMIGAPSRA